MRFSAGPPRGIGTIYPDIAEQMVGKHDQRRGPAPAPRTAHDLHDLGEQATDYVGPGAPV